MLGFCFTWVKNCLQQLILKINEINVLLELAPNIESGVSTKKYITLCQKHPPTTEFIFKEQWCQFYHIWQESTRGYIPAECHEIVFKPEVLLDEFFQNKIHESLCVLSKRGSLPRISENIHSWRSLKMSEYLLYLGLWFWMEKITFLLFSKLQD